jgi:hypothetical protein
MSGLDNTSYTVRTSAVTTTLTENDSILLVLGATGAVTVNLPAVASTVPGRSFIVYKDNAAQTITIDPAGSETIDGGATTTLLTGQVHAKRFVSNGTAWYTIGEYDSLAA